MPERHLLVLPLPTGRTGSMGRLSVFFSPRLVEVGASETLRDYPDWRAWPDVINDPAFTFEVLLDGTQVPNVNVVSPAADPAVWAAVFGGPITTEVAVEPYRFVDRTGTPFPFAYSPTALHADALTAYHQLATEFADRIPTAAERRAVSALEGLLGDNLDAALAFMQPLEPQATATAQEPSLEFHASITHLGAHPMLLRLLGIVIDVEIPLPANTPTGVSVRTNYPSLFPGPQGPVRQVRFRTNVDPGFRAQSNPDPDLSAQVRGYLPLAGGDYDLISTDTLITAQRLETFRSQANGDGAPRPLPPLREQGISVVRKDMRRVLHQMFVRQVEIEDAVAAQIGNPQAPPVELFAEDVTVGQRYDARETGTAAWRSLFARHLPDGYSFPTDASLTIAPPPDEGWQGITLLTETDLVRVPQQIPEQQPRLLDRTAQRVHDAVFRWNGWSAATRMPGRMLDGESAQTVEQQDNAPRADDAVQFRADYHVVPRSLPTLRYGRRYDLRARCVDVAGNSRALSDLEPAAAVGTEAYGRLQPVEPPTVVRRSPRPDPGEGDTTTTIVIRSEHDQDDTTVTPSDRLLFPPRIAQQRVEVHGLPNGGVDPSAYAFLAGRDALDLAAQTVVDPRTGELVAGRPTTDGIEPGPPRPTVAYLADPTTSGVGLAGLRGALDTVVVPYGGRWPDPRAVRLEVRGGSGEPQVPTPDTPTSVRVFLPKAGVCTVEVASAIDQRFLRHFTLWHEFSADERTRLRATLLAGRHWMISPRSQITLVHAVRRPLVVPSVDALAAQRPALGALTATFDGSATIDRASTQMLDLTARWTDPVDDVTEQAPGEQTRGRMLARVRVALDGDPATETFDALELELGDTKRHQVAIDVEAFSRFSRYFTERVDTSFDGTDVIDLDAPGIVAARTEVTGVDGLLYEEGIDYTVAPPGRLTRTADSRIDDTEPLSVRYLPLPVSRHSSEDDGAPADVLVPNCAPPLAVEVDAVLPAFHRTINQRGDDTIVVTHDAQALRVQVRRPWWSTGQGETLGVVLDSSPVAETVSTTTRWGRDPLDGSSGSGTPPALDDFAAAEHTALAIDGAHDVAGYAVTFDTARQAWLADVRITRDLGYRPFVQLALARYQPASLPGTHLSAITRPDPVRLGPSRVVVVERRDGAVAVTVTGHDLDNTMRVTVQHPDPAIADADLRWIGAATPVELARVQRVTDTQWTGEVALPIGEPELRLLVEDREPGAGQVDGVVAKIHTVVYAETVVLPTTWLAMLR